MSYSNMQNNNGKGSEWKKMYLFQHEEKTINSNHVSIQKYF